MPRAQTYAGAFASDCEARAAEVRKERIYGGAFAADREAADLMSVRGGTPPRDAIGAEVQILRRAAMG